MAFTPSTLALWLASAENVNAITALLESGDLKLVECSGGLTVLRTHSRDITKLDCRTISEKLAYSQMIREWTEEIANDWSAPPDASGAIPMPDPRFPWSHGEWSQYHLDSERVKARVMAREARRTKNRLLYAKPPKDDL